MSFLHNYWWATLFGVALVVWGWAAWHRARWRPPGPSQAREPAQAMRAPFRRSEFQTKAERARRQMARGWLISTAIYVFGFLALLTASKLAPTLPRNIFSGALIALLVVSIGSMFVFAIAGGRLVRRMGLVCPACGVDLVGSATTGAPPQDLVLESGQCPRCRAQLLDVAAAQ